MNLLCKIWRAWERVQIFFCYYFGRTYMCECGHATKRKSILVIDGRSGVFTVQGKKPAYCPDCWAKAAIKCAWCGNTITPGQPITLYTPASVDFKIPDHAVVYQRDPLQLVGCLGWDCSETGADRAGFWVMPGKVNRVMSPLEMLMENGCNEPIIIGDITDQKEAIPFPEE